MRKEPVVTAATISGIVIALASTFHVVLDAGTVETVIAAVLPVILSLPARARVSPTG